MTLISYLSLLGGTGMIATAVGMLGLDWYLLGKTRGRLLGAQSCPVRGGFRAELALVLLGWGPIFLAVGLATFIGGHLGGAR